MEQASHEHGKWKPLVVACCCGYNHCQRFRGGSFLDARTKRRSRDGCLADYLPFDHRRLHLRHEGQVVAPLILSWRRYRPSKTNPNFKAMLILELINYANVN